MNEPKNEHYISKFFCKPFCFEKELVYYFNQKERTIQTRNCSTIFSVEYLYKVDGLTLEEQYKIENSLGQFESEIATLIREKFLNGSDIYITRAENEKLRIFLFLMSFRSELRMEQYKYGNFNYSTALILDNYKNGTYLDLWRNEIYELSKCRSAEDIQKLNIDPIIRQDFINILSGYYMTIVDSRGQDFIMSDVLPTTEVFRVTPTINFHMHEFFPISPNRMIIFNSTIFKKERFYYRLDNPLNTKAIYDFSRIKGNAIKQPFDLRKNHMVRNPDDQYRYHVEKIYEDDVCYINSLILNECRNGFIFNNKERIKKTIEKYQKEPDKNDFGDLLVLLEKE